MDTLIDYSIISAFRMMRHHLTGNNKKGIEQLASDVCGIQALVMSFAEIALWTRNHSLKRQEIQSALWEERKLIKVSSMRGTLHLLPKNEFFLYKNAIKKSRKDALYKRLSKFGINEKYIRKMNDSIMKALSNGPLTTAELRKQAIDKSGEKVQDWSKVVWNAFRPAIVEGLICYGPARGQEVTFVRVDQWIDEIKDTDESEAKQVLFRKYLGAYGPASLRDFALWSSITMKEVKETFSMIKDDLLEVPVEGDLLFILKEDFNELMAAQPLNNHVKVLPGFDPYMLAHISKAFLIDKLHYKKVYRNQGWISPVILINGRVAGIWSHARKGKKLLIEVSPFEKFSKATKNDLNAEFAGLGDFLEFTPEIKFIV